MTKDFVNLININENEVLRYLEYKGQDISDNLKGTINECINLIKDKINPRYMLRVYPIKREKLSIVIKGTDLKLESEDLYNLLKECDKCIVMAITLGFEAEKEIRKYSYSELTKSIIIDSCATTAIEEVCDFVQDELEKELFQKGEYLTTRYSPGYGDLPIEKNIDIINLLNTQKEIGLTITGSGIMIPRKSVVAIMGIAKSESKNNKKLCSNCINRFDCKYKREVETCGCQGVYKG